MRRARRDPVDPGLNPQPLALHKGRYGALFPIDTNVVVSGLLTPGGNEALIPLAIHQGLVRPCFSNEILEEYAGAPEAFGAVSVDPGDTKFLQCGYVQKDGRRIRNSGFRRYSPAPHVCEAGLTRATSDIQSQRWELLFVPQFRPCLFQRRSHPARLAVL
jgi:hypothetical protein